jgi:hypothetical protein
MVHFAVETQHVRAVLLQVRSVSLGLSGAMRISIPSPRLSINPACASNRRNRKCKGLVARPPGARGIIAHLVTTLIQIAAQVSPNHFHVKM